MPLLRLRAISSGVVVSERSKSTSQSTSDVNHALILRGEADGSPVDNPGRHEFNTAVTSTPTVPAHFSAPQAQLHAPETLTAKPPGDPAVAEFSHEVRSALGAIYNAAHLLRMQRSETAVAMKAGILIERQVLRMRRLIDDLLDITHLRSDALCLQYARVDLRVVARHAIETLELDMVARSHRLAISLPDAPVWLMADAGRLEQVLVNLLGNAAKYTDPGGDVALSIYQSGAQAILCVRDSGIGIAPDVLPRVFDLYMQADPAARHAEAGLGIGLALVRSLVDLHGGEVSASSAGLGLGSEFSVRLPLA
jgi:signal transduction histidine kinase